jgi:hypothetical protein
MQVCETQFYAYYGQGIKIMIVGTSQRTERVRVSGVDEEGSISMFAHAFVHCFGLLVSNFDFLQVTAVLVMRIEALLCLTSRKDPRVTLTSCLILLSLLKQGH